ncbi:hypothetical protein AB1Y20_006397 [Prymnesium parvum]|uniref:Uncharacterized protein n=1 Tax=Prymnesium parvum TaxID=97485 RepID=A0AB34J1S1_PRYPA
MISLSWLLAVCLEALDTILLELCSCCAPCRQTYDEICAIIRSLKSVKGLRLPIGAAFWGEEFAADSEKLKYMGTVNRWNDPSTKQTLMVLWEGYTQCQRAPIDKMQKTESGTDLDPNYS